jgi:hypothetical protein
MPRPPNVKVLYLDAPVAKMILVNIAALGHYEHSYIDNFCRGKAIDLITFNRVSEQPEKRSPSNPVYTVEQVMAELDETAAIRGPSKDEGRVVVVIAVEDKDTEFIPACCSVLIARIREWCKFSTVCCFVVDGNGHFYEIMALAAHQTTYKFSDGNKKVDVKIERRRCRDGSFQGWTVAPWLNFIDKYDLSEYEVSSAAKQPACSTEEEEEYDYSLLMAHHLLT